MTSVVDCHQPIIALGETRKRQTLRDLMTLETPPTAVCKKPITKPNHTITKKAFRSLSFRGIAATRPKNHHVIVNIDDNKNELAVVEYVEEIYTFNKISETQKCLRDYMDSQPHINARLRALLLDWLIQIHTLYCLSPETLYLTINILDRYLSATTIAAAELQLLGISALLISSKYEEITPLTVDAMITTVDSEYSRDQILAMEEAILSRLGWNITVPTPYVFILRYTKASLPSDKEMEDMVFYFTDLGLMDYSVTIRNSPSMLVASAVYAARWTLNKTPLWTETLKHYTGYSEDQLTDCAKTLLSFHACASENKFKAVYQKYGKLDRSAVSLRPPATSLLVGNPHKAVVQIGWLTRQISKSINVC